VVAISEPVRRLLEAHADAAIVVDAAGQVVFCNAAYEAADPERLCGLTVTQVALDDGLIARIHHDPGGIDELRAAHARLVHQEKMLSLGRLVAGIAHELNNPINFIYGNVDFLGQYMEDLLGLVRALEASQALTADAHAEIARLKATIEWDYLVEDSRKLLNSIRSGAERTATIVRDLKAFSHAGPAELKEADVITSIESTLNLISPLHKNRIDIERDYERGLPRLVCNAGHIAQVFMNILTNAAQAIRGSGTIAIKAETFGGGSWLRVTIRDTGQGIAPDDVAKIADPFFTTKEVGEGTGLGLWITDNIVRAHGGMLRCETMLGEGSTFTVELPVAGPNGPL
jgi:two-component system NtrC family sensor kinase